MRSHREPLHPLLIVAGVALGFCAVKLFGDSRRRLQAARTREVEMQAERPILHLVSSTASARPSRSEAPRVQLAAPEDANDRDWVVMYSTFGGEFNFGGNKPTSPPAAPHQFFADARSVATTWELRSIAVCGRAQILNVKTGEVVDKF